MSPIAAQSNETPGIARAIGRGFTRFDRPANPLVAANAQNTRRNLNLDMIALMERGVSPKDPRILALRARIAAL